MLSFIQRHARKVIGVLSGFDRLRLRGTLRWFANVRGLKNFLWVKQVRLTEFKDYAREVTTEVRQAAEELAAQAGQKVHYLSSSVIRKEQYAREVARQAGVTEGLLAVLSCVEPCRTYKVGRNAQAKRLELRNVRGKCLHYYFYYQDPVLGFLHLRLQTWFPFTIHACLNGREWLARQMDAAGLGYVRRENCFLDVADPIRAQKLLDEQLRVDWTGLLAGFADRIHPTRARRFAETPVEYYWSADESEWATDVMFRSPKDLADVYPRLIRHGIQTFSSGDVMRFLGRKTPAHGGVNGHFLGEVVSDLKTRPEGLRLKHRLNHNSIKMYDKQGSVLRVETTINDVRDMKVYRPKEGDPGGDLDWRKLRKGVSDLHRRCQVSQAANERYLESLAAVDETTPLGELASPLCRPVQWQGRRVRGLNPFAADDLRLLEAVNRGEFAINGFRNKDLRPLLLGTAQVPTAEVRRQSAKITRLLRLLRAHGLIHKVPKTHRYVLSPAGRLKITTLLMARSADTAKLNELAI